MKIRIPFKVKTDRHLLSPSYWEEVKDHVEGLMKKKELIKYMRELGMVE